MPDHGERMDSGHLLPVTPHVALLQIAVAESDLASVAGIRMGGGSVHLVRTCNRDNAAVEYIRCGTEKQTRESPRGLATNSVGGEWKCEL